MMVNIAPKAREINGGSSSFRSSSADQTPEPRDVLGLQEHFSRFRSAPHSGHSPRQSSRQSRFIGSAKVISVRTSSEMSQVSIPGGVSTKN